PPPRLNHSTSTLFGMLPPIHSSKINTTPIVNEMRSKWCAYFAHPDQVVSAREPNVETNKGGPKVMLRPVTASMMKQVAVIQWTKRSNLLHLTILRPERPLLSITIPRIR